MLLSGKTPKTLFSFHNAQVGQIYHRTSTKAGNASHTSLDILEGRLTLPFPAPCLGLSLRPGDFRRQQTPAWPWLPWSGNSRRTPPTRTRAATARGVVEEF